MIREYSNTTYLLQPSVHQREGLIQRHTFKTVKLAQNNPENFSLCA